MSMRYIQWYDIIYKYYEIWYEIHIDILAIDIVAGRASSRYGMSLRVPSERQVLQVIAGRTSDEARNVWSKMVKVQG